MNARTTTALLGSMLLAPPMLAAQAETDELEPRPESCPHACCFDDPTYHACDVFDFMAFQWGFVTGDPCAIDMDTSTGVGVGDIFDFLVFQQEFLDGLRFGFQC